MFDGRGVKRSSDERSNCLFYAPILTSSIKECEDHVYF